MRLEVSAGQLQPGDLVAHNFSNQVALVLSVTRLGRPTGESLVKIIMFSEGTIISATNLEWVAYQRVYR